MKKRVFAYSAILLFLVLLVLAGNKFFSKRQNLSDQKITTFKETATDLRAVSFITPHHLLAEELIEEVFQKFSKLNEGAPIERIILISPNHFNQGNAPAVIPDIKENIGEKDAEIDENGVGKILAQEDLFQKSGRGFEKDHGIFNILPYVSKYFPEAKIIPLMIRDGIGPKKVKRIEETVSGNFPKNTVVILSADFSHYIGWPASRMHDRKAIEIISNLDTEKVSSLDVDCQGGLQILLDYSRKAGCSEFNLLKNSNSSEILGRDTGSENTSYVTGYFSRGEIKSASSTVNLLFLGDLMMDRYNRIILEKKGIGWPTEKVGRIFWSQDANIANLEGPITSNDSVSLSSREDERRNLIFTFDPEQAKYFLANNRINLVSIGNNHINNFGPGGLIETKNNLREWQMDFFGDPSSEENYILKNLGGYQVAFVSYNQFGGPSFEKTLENIRVAEKKSDFAVVYCHWGSEYQLRESKDQKERGRAFIDAGADAVIGSHPHVVQPVEIYKNKAIFYSLGNFFFDQYFSKDSQEMLAAGAVFSEKSATFYLTPLFMGKDGQISIGQKKLLERIAVDSNVDELVRDGIMRGEFTLNF